jgi:hypothetical protein
MLLFAFKLDFCKPDVETLAQKHEFVATCAMQSLEGENVKIPA